MTFPMNVSVHLQQLDALALYRTEVLNALRMTLAEHIPRSSCRGHNPSEIITRHFSDLFVRWVYDANTQGCLEGFLPITSLVHEADLQYFCTKYDITGPVSYSRLEAVSLPKTIKSKYTIPAYQEVDETVVLGSLSCTKTQYIRMRQLYQGPFKYFNWWVYVALRTYEVLDGSNNNLAIPPGVLDALSGPTELSVVELFGSPLNTSKSYCSPFEFERRRFRSLGSAFKLDFQPETIYVANPPFDERLMERIALHLCEAVEKLEGKVTFVVFLPIWDSVTQRQEGLPDRGRKFKALDLLCKSPYLHSRSLSRKNTHRFYDYGTERFLPIIGCHVLVLGKGCGSNAKQILQYWKDNCLSDHA